jgi:hypothetical protein
MSVSDTEDVRSRRNGKEIETASRRQTNTLKSPPTIGHASADTEKIYRKR